ncbi:MAG: hypothetical protein PHS92_03495 [Candidatus Gracilibacteria bacterium]|nr:hypothetical protein [Candidatus Gracilibacteria bacterium]
MGKTLDIGDSSKQFLLSDEEMEFFRSWHPKKNADDIIEVWQDGKLKMVKFADGKKIGFPSFTKEYTTTAIMTLKNKLLETLLNN